MPIRFRCAYCNRLLGIATRKAGTQTTCPHCGYTITVPQPDAEQTDRVSLDDVEELLGSAVPRASAVPAPAAAQSEPEPHAESPKPVAAAKSAPPAAAPVATPTPVTKPGSPTGSRAPAKPSDERPLFEGDVDDILGTTPAAEEPTQPKRAATSGMDAMSLGEPTAQVSLSAKNATLLVVVVVILLALAFAAGVFLSPRG